MLSKIQSCFAQTEVNTDRQLEMDIAKGFAIIFMVWVHVLEELETVHWGAMETIIDAFLGSPFAAPVFMVCMGIGMGYSRHNKSGDFMKRGFSLLLIGFVLNIFRSTIPQIIIWRTMGTITLADIWGRCEIFSVN